MNILTRVRELDVAWYGAAAGAAVAGAMVFPERKVLAGGLAGLVVLAIGVFRHGGACCAECAGAQPTSAPMGDEPVSLPNMPLDLAMTTGAGPVALQSTRCGGA